MTREVAISGQNPRAQQMGLVKQHCEIGFDPISRDTLSAAESSRICLVVLGGSQAKLGCVRSPSGIHNETFTIYA